MDGLSDALAQALDLFEQGDDTLANLKLSNWYHQKNRTIEEYRAFLVGILDEGRYQAAAPVIKEKVNFAVWFIERRLRYREDDGPVYVDRVQDDPGRFVLLRRSK